MPLATQSKQSPLPFWAIAYASFSAKPTTITNNDGTITKGGLWWYCRLCDDEKQKHTIYKAGNGAKKTWTTGPFNHLEGEDHGLKVDELVAEAEAHDLDPEEFLRRKRRRGNYGNLINQSHHSLAPAPSTDDGDAPTRAMEMLAKNAFIELLSVCDSPLAIIESGAFRQFLYVWNPTLTEKVLPKNEHTIRRWLVAAFEENSEALRRQLYTEAISLIHLYWDIWTSPNQVGIVAFVAHFVDREHSLRTRLIALRVINGRHTGENLAYHIQKAISDFKLQNTAAENPDLDEFTEIELQKDPMNE